MDAFDTTGTLIGVTEQAGLAWQGRLERAREAMLADAIGTVGGACLGISTVTSYVESAAGVQLGDRTSLTAVTVAILFLLAFPLTPMISMIGSYPSITNPALVLVGAMLAGNVTKVRWPDASEAIPAFLIILGIPLTFSIADGIALGLIAYPAVKLFGGKPREAHWSLYVLTLLLVAYFLARSWAGAIRRRDSRAALPGVCLTEDLWKIKQVESDQRVFPMTANTWNCDFIDVFYFQGNQPVIFLAANVFVLHVTFHDSAASGMV